MTGPWLRVNPMECKAHGLCAELFPEMISLDEWEYPIPDPRPVRGELVGHARRGVRLSGAGAAA